MELKPSLARMDMIKSDDIQECLKKDYEVICDTSGSDDGEEIYDINHLRKSISVTTVASLEFNTLQNSSKSNLHIAPSLSVASLNERFKQLDKCQENDQNFPVAAQLSYDSMGLGFSRDELTRRLRNLIRISMQKHDGNLEVTLTEFIFHLPHIHNLQF